MRWARQRYESTTERMPIEASDIRIIAACVLPTSICFPKTYPCANAAAIMAYEYNRAFLYQCSSF